MQKKILKKIENDEIVVEHTAKKHEDTTNQIGFGDGIANEIADELKNMDVTTYTPIEAMNKFFTNWQTGRRKYKHLWLFKVTSING